MKTFLKSTLKPSDFKVAIIDIDNTLYKNDSYLFHQEDSLMFLASKYKDVDFAEFKEYVKILKEIYHEMNNINSTLSNVLSFLGISLDQIISMRESSIKPSKYLNYDDLLFKSITDLSNIYSLVALSNNPEKITKEVLGILKIRRFFSHIIGPETYGLLKPSLKIIENIRALFRNLEYEEILSIGDRFNVDLNPVITLGGGGILIQNIKDIYNIKSFLEG